MDTQKRLIQDKLLMILKEFEGLKEIVVPQPETCFDVQLQELRELVVSAGEYGTAFKSIVEAVKAHRVPLPSEVAVSLIEVGVLMRFKPEKGDARKAQVPE